MAETLKEIVARAISEGYGETGSFQHAEVVALAVLRNPPPETIEAGAKAIYTLYWPSMADHWDKLDPENQAEYAAQFLASWRAAIDG